MPISLTESQKKKILGQIRQTLPSVEIQENYRISCPKGEVFPDIDDSISIDTKYKNELITMIGDNPIERFFSTWIYDEFWERDVGDIDSQKLSELTDIPSFEHIANEMLSEFLKLPHSYKLIFPLPSRFKKLINDTTSEVELGPHITAFKWPPEGDSRFNEVYLHEAELTSSTFMMPEPKKKALPEIALQIDMSGYFDMRNSLNSAHDFISIVRSLMGLFYATNLIRYFDNSNKEGSSLAFRYRKEAFGFDFDGVNVVSGSFFRALANCYATSRSDNERLYKYSIDRIRAVMKSTKAGKISLAARWIFDSLTGDNELLSFVQATICLEILLGDQKHADQLSIGDILSNRCAYMIGRNDIERESILKDFKSIYSVRSEIVHRGKPRLSTEDRKQFSKLMGYASRVIVKEIDLLSEENTA